MSEVHVCPILMRTVIWNNQKCSENCDETECPIKILESKQKSEIITR